MTNEKENENFVNEQTKEKSTDSQISNELVENKTEQSANEDINLTTETDSIPEPKKVERKIKHPITDVVRYEDPDLDSNWGWAIEFPNTDLLVPMWDKLKTFLEKGDHPLKGKVSWLSMDPRGYFSPRLRHFISFTGWGIQIENLPDWFKQNITDLQKPVKSIEPSEELAVGNWQGYIVKEKIDLKGPEFVKLDNFSRNKRKTVEEPKNPISSNIPRYWAQRALYTARDYLIPVITEEKYNSGDKSAVSYLEEYIIEQLDWKEANKEDKFVILPSEFTFDDKATRKVNIPEEYTPEISYDYPGMFPGMGGLGGMGGMGDLSDMPDLGDLPDLDDSELGDEDSDEVASDTTDKNTEDANMDSQDKQDAIDAEVIPEDK